MSEYTAFNNAVVALKDEPKISTFVPKSGPNAGKETNSVEIKAYKPNFIKNEDGKLERAKESTFFTVKYYGSKDACERIAASVKPGMMLDIRGESTVREYQGKDGKTYQENIISAKGIAVSLAQKGVTVNYEPPVKKKAVEQER